MHRTIGGGGYGQNLAASTGFDIGKALSDQLYNGEFSHYAPFGPISKQGMTGHLTQMIWVASSRLGCYTHHCANGIQKTSFAGYYTVCNYDPTGTFSLFLPPSLPFLLPSLLSPRATVDGGPRRLTG